jgi:hypothetical protein
MSDPWAGHIQQTFLESGEGARTSTSTENFGCPGQVRLGNLICPEMASEIRQFWTDKSEIFLGSWFGNWFSII